MHRCCRLAESSNNHPKVVGNSFEAFHVYNEHICSAYVEPHPHNLLIDCLILIGS